MRFSAFAFAASALVVAACGGGDKGAESTTVDSATTAAGAATTPAPDAAAGGAAAGTATAAPATGTTHTVNMVGDAQGYRFDPANVTVKQGDAIRFVMVSGGPHNVAFDEAGIPAAGKAQLAANIPNPAAPLSSQMVMNPNEEIVISFANVAPGAYSYNCTPHLAMGMKGVVTVQ